MAHIFLSYSHKDSDYAHKLASEMTRQGIEVWIDDRIDYGDRWPQVIQQHLESSQALVVLMTNSAYQSIWVQNELAFAQYHNKHVFPVLLEGGLWVALASTQHVDVRNGKLPPVSYFKTLKKHIGVSEKDHGRAFVPITRPVRKPSILENLEEEALTAAIVDQLAKEVKSGPTTAWKIGLFRLRYEKYVYNSKYIFSVSFDNIRFLSKYDPMVYEEYKNGLEAVNLSTSENLSRKELDEKMLMRRLNLQLGRFWNQEPSRDEIERFVTDLIQIHKDHYVPLSEIKVQPAD